MLLLTLALVACNPDEPAVTPATGPNGGADHALACKRDAGDAERRLVRSMGSASPSTAVVVTRRNHEQICLQEVSCLAIEGPALGPFLQQCLAAAEHDPREN